MRAYDLGTPSYDDRITLTVEVQDKDDNPPFFDRARFPPPYTVSVQEGDVAPHMASLNIASDPDTGNNSRICYYIVGACPVPNTGTQFLNTSISNVRFADVSCVEVSFVTWHGYHTHFRK